MHYLCLMKQLCIDIQYMWEFDHSDCLVRTILEKNERSLLKVPKSSYLKGFSIFEVEF